MVTSTSEECPDDGPNPWLRLAPEEMKECVEKERLYKKNLQEKLLQKAAADVEETLESRKRFLPLLSCPNATGNLDAEYAPRVQPARPVIYGSAIYRGLWAKAATISNNTVDLLETNPLDSPVVSTPDIVDGGLVTMSCDGQSVEQVSMMSPHVLGIAQR